MSATAWTDFRSDVVAAVNAGVAGQFARRTWTSAQIEQKQADDLRRLIVYAAEHSPFHRRRLEKLRLDDLHPSDLSLLPIMTKADMMASLDEVFTDRRLSRRMVEPALADTGPEPNVILEQYVALASGGSSGNRGVFVYDRPALTSFATAVSRPPIEAPVALEQPEGKPVFAMVTAASPMHATGMTVALCEGDNAPAKVHSIPATLPIADIVQQLNDVQPEVLSGYASMLTRLAGESRAGRLTIAPQQVSSTSETLHPEMRAVIRSAFGVPVFDGFGTTEGLFGKTGPDEAAFVFNTDMCIVELVDDANNPVAPGIPSTKVLLTNLYNLTQPLIRYEISDTFIREADADNHGYLRALVRGRNDDTLRFGTAEIHPITIRAVMLTTPQVTEYQIHQTSRGIDLLAVCTRDLDSRALTERLQAALADAGIPRPAVTVRMVEHLDRHPATGKLRAVIPLTAGGA